MRDLIQPAAILFAVCVVVVGLLAYTDQLTAPLIAERTQIDLDNAKKAVLPLAVSFEAIALPADLATQTEGLATVQGAWLAKDATGALVGTVVSAASKGYSGPVGFTVGLDPSGKVTAVRAGAHKETPGLGDKVLVPTSKVMKQFPGLTPTAPLKTVKGNPAANEIDAISGSTITSRAAARAVSGAWELTQTLKPQGESHE